MDETNTNLNPSAQDFNRGEHLLPRHARPQVDGQMLARRIDEAATLPQKAELLWSLPTLERHAALGALNAETVAALIESNPEENTALMGNLPAQKFTEIINLGAPEHGRRWLERAVSSKMLAAQILPALLSARDLMLMLMSSGEFRTALSGLLNFRRAEEMRSLLHPLEWKNSLDDLLLADAEELLHKAPIKDRNIRAILQSLLDFLPELYLDVIRLSLEQAKYQEDRGDELADIIEMPFGMPEFLKEGDAPQAASGPESVSSSAAGSEKDRTRNAAMDLIPTTGDPFLQLATAQLPVDRRDQLEAELKDLLRREILATGSFSQADLLRAAGRLLFQIRAGLLQVGVDTPKSATQALLTRTFGDIVLMGARVAERYRQRALQLAGVRDWLDRSQRQFLTAMNTLEPGVDPETGGPALYLPTRTNQQREDWQPLLLPEVDATINEITAWSALARAAFGSPARMQSIFAALKTRTAEEAARRTILALCLYRRWEPELVNPAEDFPEFKREFTDKLGRLDPAREVVLQALDATSPDAWKPADAKLRAKEFLMNIIDKIERPVDRAGNKERVQATEQDISFDNIQDD